METKDSKTMIVEKFNQKIKLGDWGKVLNSIQSAAEEVLDEKEFDSYLTKSNKDADDCDGMDGILFNGKYFDWREFKTKAKEIVLAYLKYFNDSQLKRIANKLC